MFLFVVFCFFFYCDGRRKVFRKNLIVINNRKFKKKYIFEESYKFKNFRLLLFNINEKF